MTRGGKKKASVDGAERKCIVTGETAPKAGLIRFVVGPDATIVPDLAEKLPGRGIWVSADRAAIDKAARKGLFSRAARTKVNAPDDLAERVEAMLARRVVDLLGLARKSGGAVAGFEKVKDWLAKDEAEVLIQASDGSGRGKSKLSTPQGGRFIGWLTADELGLAFGRQNVIHVALAAGGLAPRVVEEAARLKGLRLLDGGDSAGKDKRRT
ncbi:RNA-binding protein [Lutimaribacter sp. EGI FJ00015]|uniref:RNA-binding protein n=1 Tax=Lutimaribacter degradans TaxID=2945989 RepID=A0ACC5ZVF0_9RHOB|nr:RNA-binding protein [Lutimaribacter sp. EGI FJ00013]MCM2561933.1 RNA-binding protein [Lutimaribacter sp. EGI FJ00013]MCO0613035.1 RNA-binding protein [Lutimaribacter sp. EGI FJ00015]MCO0635765.1 RNA-binding protein [Lutimaribacter sp. EGI FJ00014]